MEHWMQVLSIDNYLNIFWSVTLLYHENFSNDLNYYTQFLGLRSQDLENLMKEKLEVFVGFRLQLLPCTKFPLLSRLPFLVRQIYFPTLMTTMKVWTSYNKFRFGGLNRSLSPNMVRNVNINCRKNWHNSLSYNKLVMISVSIFIHFSWKEYWSRKWIWFCVRPFSIRDFCTLFFQLNVFWTSSKFYLDKNLTYIETSS